jgi:hypothetical protein
VGTLNDEADPYGSVSGAITALSVAYPDQTVTLRLLDSPAFGGTVNISDVAGYLTVMSHGGTKFTLDTQLLVNESVASSVAITLDNVTADIQYEQSTNAGANPSGGTIYGLNSATCNISGVGANGDSGANGTDDNQYGENGTNGADDDFSPGNGTNGSDGPTATGGAGESGVGGGYGYDVTVSGSIDVSANLSGGYGGSGGNGGSANSTGGSGGNGGNSNGTFYGGVGGNGGYGGSAYGGNGGSGGGGGNGGNLTTANGATATLGFTSDGGYGGSWGNGGSANSYGGVGGQGGYGTTTQAANGPNGSISFIVSSGLSGSEGSAGSNGSLI